MSGASFSHMVLVISIDPTIASTITAGHNPTHWNALKFVRQDGLYLTPGQAEELLDIYHQGRFEKAVIGVRSIIRAGAHIEETVVMGADFIESEADKAQAARMGQPAIGIGRNVKIRRAIIDKNARIGDNVVIENAKGLTDFDAPNYNIRDGIVIVPKGETIPEGTVI